MQVLIVNTRTLVSALTKSPNLQRVYSIANDDSLGTKSLDYKRILALDFDGVICASSGESSYSSIIAARTEWPSECSIDELSDEFTSVQLAVNSVRPIVETGFENMLLVRWFLNELRSDGRIDVENVLTNWSPVFRDDLVKKYGRTKQQLVSHFGTTRDELIKKNLKDWVKLNSVRWPNLTRLRSMLSQSSVTSYYYLDIWLHP